MKKRKILTWKYWWVGGTTGSAVPPARRTNNQPTIGRLRVQGLLK